MNIFVLDKYPASAVRMLCDCHVRKMCVETAQILSGVMIRKGMELIDGMPKPQNVYHPVIVAVNDPQAVNWLLQYNIYLHLEYFSRFKKVHSCEKWHIFYYEKLKTLAGGMSCENLAKCCGDLDVAELDIVAAYRMYYTEVKKPQLIAKNLWKFTGREDWTR